MTRHHLPIHVVPLGVRGDHTATAARPCRPTLARNLNEPTAAVYMAVAANPTRVADICIPPARLTRSGRSLTGLDAT